MATVSHCQISPSPTARSEPGHTPFYPHHWLGLGARTLSFHTCSGEWSQALLPSPYKVGLGLGHDPLSLQGWMQAGPCPLPPWGWIRPKSPLQPPRGWMGPHCTCFSCRIRATGHMWPLPELGTTHPGCHGKRLSTTALAFSCVPSHLPRLMCANTV